MSQSSLVLPCKISLGGPGHDDNTSEVPQVKTTNRNIVSFNFTKLTLLFRYRQLKDYCVCRFKHGCFLVFFHAVTSWYQVFYNVFIFLWNWWFTVRQFFFLSKIKRGLAIWKNMLIITKVKVVHVYKSYMFLQNWICLLIYDTGPLFCLMAHCRSKVILSLFIFY